MVVYLDLVVLLNFLVDFLLLMGTNRLSGFPLEPLRAAVAALLGGIYGGMCLLRGFHFLSSFFWRFLVLVLLSLIAFGYDRTALKRGGVFILLSMALGGIAVCAETTGFLTLILAAAGVWILCRAAFGETVGGREYVPLSLTYGGSTVNLIALRDSGNTLRDPITGEGVFLISADAASRLTGLSLAQLNAPMDTLTQRPVPGLRLIPYCSIGRDSGILLALRFDQVKVGNRVQSAIVAFAPEGLGSGQCYQALVT